MVIASGATATATAGAMASAMVGAMAGTHFHTRAHLHTRAYSHVKSCMHEHSHKRSHSFWHTRALAHSCTRSRTLARTHAQTCTHTHSQAIASETVMAPDEVDDDGKLRDAQVNSRAALSAMPRMVFDGAGAIHGTASPLSRRCGCPLHDGGHGGCIGPIYARSAGASSLEPMWNPASARAAASVCKGYRI